MAFKLSLPRLRHFIGQMPGRRRLLSLHRLLGSSVRIGSVAIADQAIVSGVNFITAVILARYLSPTSYGHYVLLFAVLLFVNGLQTALITAPLMVIAPRYEAQAGARYLNSLWVIQLLGISILVVLVVAFMLLARIYLPNIAAVFEVGPLVLVFATYLGQEFIRRVLFSQRDSLGGAGVDLISYGLQLAALLGLIVFGGLSLTSVLWAMGLTSLASCLFGALRALPTLSAVQRSDIAATWREHWGQGRWLASSSLALWGSTQLYFFVVAAMLSPADTAVLAACRNLLGFSHIFLLATENFVPSMVTRRLLHGGVDAVVQWLNKFRLVGGSAMIIFCLIVTLFADPLMRGLFGSQYSNTAQIVGLVAISYALIIFVRSCMIGLRVLGKVHWNFIAYFIAAVITAIGSAPLISAAGLVGAAVGMIATQVIVLVVSGFGYVRVVRASRGAKHSEEVGSVLMNETQ
jgi:O-antigen/teichoic acid export membrane protein